MASNLEDILRQMGNSLADFRAKASDLDALAKSGGTQEFLNTANYLVSSRLRLADSIDEMISSIKLPIEGLTGVVNSQNQVIKNALQEIAITNGKISDAVKLAQAAGTTNPALNEALRTIRDRGDDLLNSTIRNSGSLDNYVAVLSGTIDTLANDVNFQREAVDKYVEQKRKQRDKLAQQVTITQNQLTNLVTEQASDINNINTMLSGSGLTTLNIGDLAGNARTRETTLQYIATNRQKIIETLDDSSRGLFLRLEKEATTLQSAAGVITNIETEVGAGDFDTRLATTDTLRTRIQDTIIADLRSRLDTLQSEVLAKKEDEAKRQDTDLAQKKEKVFAESQVNSLKSIQSMSEFLRISDKGGQSVSNFTFAFGGLVKKLYEGQMSFSSLGGIIKGSFLDPVGSLKSATDTLFSAFIPLNKMLELSTKTAEINTSTGGLAGNIRDIAISSGAAAGTNAALKQLNATLNDMLEATKELTLAIPGFLSNFNQSTIVRLSNTAVEMKRLGIESSKLGSIIQNLRGFMDENATSITDNIEAMEDFGVSLQVGAKVAVDAFEKLSKSFAGFYTDFTSVTKTFLAASAASGASIDTLVNITKKFGDFEQTAKMVQSLNYALGGFNLNVIELQRLKPEDRILRFVEALRMSGRNFADLAPQIQQYVASAMGVEDVTEMARVASLSISQIEANRAKGEKEANARLKATQLSLSLQTRLNNLLVSYSPLINRILKVAEGLVGILEAFSNKFVFIGLFVIGMGKVAASIFVAYRQQMLLNQAIGAGTAGVNALNNATRAFTLTMSAITAIAGIAALIAILMPDEETDSEGLRPGNVLGVGDDLPTTYGGTVRDGASMNISNGKSFHTVGIDRNDSSILVDFTKKTPFSSMISSVLNMFGVNTGISNNDTSFSQTLLSTLFGGDNSTVGGNTASSSFSNSIKSLFSVFSPEVMPSVSESKQTIVSNMDKVTSEAMSRSSTLASNYYDKQNTNFERQNIMLQKVSEVVDKSFTQISEKETKLAENVNLVAKFDFTGFSNEFEKRVLAKVDQRFTNSPFTSI